MSTGLFPIARRDAGDVFKTECEQLSVQEVHRRERAAGVEPLLPLPTTENTATLDDFSSYGAREWSPSVTWPTARPAAIDEAQDNLATPSSPTATFANVYNAPASQTPAAAHSPSSSTQIMTPPGSPTTTAPSQVPITTGLMTQPANTDQDFPSQEQTEAIGTTAAPQQIESDQPLPAMLATSSSPMADASTSMKTSQQIDSDQSLLEVDATVSSPIVDHTSTNATTPSPPGPAEDPMRIQETVSERGPTQEELIRIIIGRLGNKPTKQQTPPPIEEQAPPPTPPSVTVRQDISALAGRGIHGLEVKQKRGKKRPASESPAPNDSVIGTNAIEQTSEVAPPSVKRLKTLKGPRAPAPLSARDPSPPPESKSTKKRPASSAPNDTSPPAKKKTKKQPASSPQEEASPPPKKSRTKKQPGPAKPTGIRSKDQIEAVIAGTILPRTAAEAKQAANIRHKRLLDQHKAAVTSRKKRANHARKTNDVGLMPEFFDAESFPDSEQVRCMCGGVADDMGPTICCDECMVWEHQQCVGEALPEHKDEDDYRCRMCDPWTHREVIAKLRRGEALV